MTKKPINQNDTHKMEFLDSIDYEYIFNDTPINRLENEIITAKILPNKKLEYLEKLKIDINAIKDCKLKSNSKNIVFGDGNINSSLMIVGGSPSEKDDLNGKTYAGEDGDLLKKMLLAINIKKEKVYITYAVNFRPTFDKKPTLEEIKRYSNFLQRHISIINPKIIIIMGGTAMESLTGLNNKISIQRRIWKEIMIKNISYNTLIIFDPSYLLKVPENKKHSWEDLKKVKQKITNLNLSI